MGYLIFLLLIIFTVAMVIANNTPDAISGNWKHFYDGIQFSTTDFYAQVKQGLVDRKVDGLSYAKQSFLESHIFSARREYLRITEHEYVFYICAAPFGTGTFVSWWLCVKDEKLINKIPILNKLAGKDRNNKSFYQMDTEAMYKSVIQSTVTAVADGLTKEQGFRLSELDRQYKDIASK